MSAGVLEQLARSQHRAEFIAARARQRERAATNVDNLHWRVSMREREEGTWAQCVRLASPGYLPNTTS
jgi:hypothetical protein